MLESCLLISRQFEKYYKFDTLTTKTTTQSTKSKVLEAFESRLLCCILTKHLADTSRTFFGKDAVMACGELGLYLLFLFKTF